MRCAFFGGSFDPPHSGHLRIARAAAERMSLDSVVLAPVGRQPLKAEEATPFADRLAMVHLLVAGQPGLAASDVDAPRTRPNYTAETLPLLRALPPFSDPGAELFLLAGMDSFLTLRHWGNAPALLRPAAAGGLLTGWIVAARPGFATEALQDALPDGFTLGAPQATSDSAKPVCRPISDPSGEAATPLYLLEDLDDPAAATDIRAALHEGAAPGSLTPPVAQYIREHGLYAHPGENAVG